LNCSFEPPHRLRVRCKGDCGVELVWRQTSGYFLLCVVFLTETGDCRINVDDDGDRADYWHRCAQVWLRLRCSFKKTRDRFGTLLTFVSPSMRRWKVDKGLLWGDSGPCPGAFSAICRSRFSPTRKTHVINAVVCSTV